MIVAEEINMLSRNRESIYRHSTLQVTELCTGGELFDRIIQKTESEEGHYSERDAANIVHKILGYVRQNVEVFVIVVVVFVVVKVVTAAGSACLLQYRHT